MPKDKSLRTSLTPKYIIVRDSVLHQIHNGLLKSGDRIASLRELCKQFDISYVTAHKVQKELQKTGMIQSIPGRGMFVNNLEIVKAQSQVWDKLKKIRFIGAEFAIGHDREGGRIVAEMKSQCEELGLEFEVEYISVSMPPTGILNNGYHVKNDEAVVFFYHSFLLPEIALLLMAKDIRRVAINFGFPDVPSILPDIIPEVRQVLDYLHKNGCNRITYAGCFAECINMYRENNSLQSFKAEANKRKIETTIITSGNCIELFDHINNEKPDAVIFSTNLGWRSFEELAAQRLDYNPEMLCLYASTPEETSGCQTDFKATVTAAIDILQGWETPEEIPFDHIISSTSNICKHKREEIAMGKS
jgi:DNA-binding transcriptional regulator YhcF (GntR family)